MGGPEKTALQDKGAMQRSGERVFQAQGKTSAKVMGSKKASDGLLSRGKDICAYETGGRQENGDNIVCDGGEK